ncbi:MAG: hypothetical protein V3U96_02975 [Paracoccaceae bacterium]
MEKQTVRLEADGFCVVKGVFSPDKIANFRDILTQNLDEMGQTRNVAHSFHLAGFHRFSKFDWVTEQIETNPAILDFLRDYYCGSSFSTLGLSDITINRSQQWHTDLLRGQYAKYLDGVNPWARPKGDCIKALVYLQNGKSLRIVQNSHRYPSPFDDRAIADVAQAKNVTQLSVRAGDVVMLDIRAIHRGSTDAEMSDPKLSENPKILLSTVFGRTKSAFSEAMRIGNADRMQDWDSNYIQL